MIAMAAVRMFANRVRRSPTLSRLALALLPNTVRVVQLPEIGPFAFRVRVNRNLWLRDVRATEKVPWTMLRSLVKVDSVVFDCGANLGLYCRYLANTLGCKQVYAFEPDPINRGLLAQNVRLGKSENTVVVLPYALADIDGELEFEVDDIQSTSGTLSRASHGEASEGRRNLNLPSLKRLVACRTIDSLLRIGEIPLPTVLKIDVEGAEALLLQGASELLKRHGPDLVVELHGAAVAQEVLHYLVELGFHLVGNVERHIDSSGFALLHRETGRLFRGQYDLRFLAASKSAERAASVLARLKV